jgi:RHS repeat-associated protein
LQYFEKRYYDNRIGKFTTQDPVFWEVGLTNRPSQYILDPDQWNTYSYVRNNPINLVDPMGEEVDYTKTEKDSSTGNSYYQVTNITTQDLDSHYTSHNGLSLQVSFSEIDTSFIQATSFDSIRNQILA